MAYIVNKTDLTVVAKVADGTIDTTSTSITILGKGFNNYGEIVAEDLVHMMEHFALDDPPAYAIRGQMWFDTTTGVKRLKVNTSNIFNSPTWAAIGSVFLQAIAPTTGIEEGSLWYDTANDALNISLDGTTFTPIKAVVVGTSEPAGATEGDLWYDTTTKELKVYNAALHGGSAGFDVVGPARHQTTEPTTNLKDGDLWWDSDNKQLFVYDEVTSSFRLVGPTTPVGVSVLGGFTGVVVDSIGTIPLVIIKIGDEVIGVWSPEDVAGPPSATDGGCDISAFTNLLRGLNLTPATGPSSEPTLFGGDATGAFYADLAERYAVDGPVEAGDLVSMGGEAEITKTTVENDLQIFGVVSTNPGLKLNSAAGEDKTHPFIAMTGRVPCKVIGAVKKGDRLVSSNIPGVARVATPGQIMNIWPAIIGRALEEDITSGQKTIEIVVGVK